MSPAWLKHPTVNLDEVRDEASALRVIARAFVVKAKVLNEARRRAPSLSRREALRLARRLLNNRWLGVAALAQAVRNDGKFGIGKWTPQRIVALGCRLKAEISRGDAVIVHPLRFGEPDSRLVFDFSTYDKARHALAHEVCRALTPLPDWMFLYNGGDAASQRWMNEHLRGAKLVLLTDVPKCFPLLPWQLVGNGLRLPSKVCQALLFDPWKSARVRGLGFEGAEQPSWEELILGKNAPMGSLGSCVGKIGIGRGIPTGSALSSLAAQVALQHVLSPTHLAEAHAEGVAMGLLADNLIFCLSDEKSESSIREALHRSVSNHFDPLVAHELCRRITPHDPAKAFRYLGRLVRLDNDAPVYDAVPDHCDRLVRNVVDDVMKAKMPDHLVRPVLRILGFANFNNAGPNTAKAIIQASLALATQLDRENPHFRDIDHIDLAALAGLDRYRYPNKS